MGSTTCSDSAFFWRIATLVSRSGGWKCQNQAPPKRERQPFFSSIRSVPWADVGGMTTMLHALVQRMNVWKNSSCVALSGVELNVIDQQHVHGAETSRKLASGRCQRGDHLVGELLGRGVADAGHRLKALHLVAEWRCIRCVLPIPTPPYRKSGL